MLMDETALYQFVCLGFSPNSRIVYSYGDVTSEGLQYLTYFWHSSPLSIKGCLACQTYHDTLDPFLMAVALTTDTER